MLIPPDDYAAASTHNLTFDGELRREAEIVETGPEMPQFSFGEGRAPGETQSWGLPPAARPSQESSPPSAETASPAAPLALDAYAGGQIAFASYRDGDNEVYMMEADGSNQVNLSNNSSADDAQPVIGPSGKIAFISNRDGNLEIYVMEPDGGNQSRITTSAGDEGWMDWSPDGGKLVFVYNEGAAWRLETINANGTGRAILLEDDDPFYDAAWSPDGSTIAFFWGDSANPGVYTIPATGGSETLLPLGAAEEPSWSPDGSRLAVTLVDYDGGQSWIYVTNLDGTVVTRVSPGASFTLQNGVRSGGDNWPSWSPDGRRIVYASDWGGGFQMVYVALADGGNADTHVNLSASIASDYQPDWGPGGFIPPAIWGPLSAYQTGGVDAIGSIHLYDLETAQDTIVAQGSDLRLAGLWADWLVYQKLNSDGSYDIWVQEISSGATTGISLDLPASSSNRPYIEGGRVYWRQVQGTNTTIGAGFYEYDLNTGDTFLLDFDPVNQNYYRYSRYQAEDGRLIYIHESNQPYLVDLDQLAVSALPFAGVALPGGVSGNVLAALENGAGGNDVLATYTISPTTRTQVTTGLDGAPSLSGESLAWVQGGSLYRQSLFDDLSAAQISSNAAAFALDSDLLLWLDGSGIWNNTQGEAAAVYVGLDDFEGDADFTEPVETTTLALSPQAGDWQDRWLAKVTGGSVCYLDGDLKNGQPPHCVKYFAGFKIYANFEIFVEPGDTVDIALRDGSYLLVRGGSYLVFKPFYPSSLETIQGSLDATFDVLTIKELEDAIEKYQQTGDTSGIDLGKLSNDMTAINAAAEKLIQQAEAGIQTYTSAGRQAPRYLQLVSGGLGAVAGASGRLGSVFGLLQVIENTTRFNYPFYRDKLNVAFKNYFETIARVNNQGVYSPKDPGSEDYYLRAEVLLRMLLRDGRDCFEEKNWTAAFYTDGSFLLSSPNCGQVTWSKDQIANLIANADTDILRREVLRPLYKDSLDWYNNVVGLFTPSEAALAFSLLTGSNKPQQVVINAGRMRFEKLSALKRAIDVKTFTFPGAKVYVWGTTFEAEITDDGSGDAFVEEGMPVLANLNTAAPDAYGITWQDNSLVLDAPPGTGPLDVPYRDDNLAPFVVELIPNENFALTPDNFAVQIRFSQAMDGATVTAHGLLTITHSAQGDFFAGALGSLPYAWDSISATLTLTPTIAPEVGLYQMDLALPASVTSLGGVAAQGAPLSVQFAIVSPVGSPGGSIATVNGASLTVPAAGGFQAQADTAYEIHASHVFSSPENWYPADDLAFWFLPAESNFTGSAPAIVTMPAPEARQGAAIFRYADNEWQELGGAPTSDEMHIQVETTELGLFAVFWPKPPASPTYIVNLPLITNGTSGITIGGSLQCDPFAGGVSCGQPLTGISMGAADDGWAVGPEILLHYANGQWRRATAADMDLFDGNTPSFNAVDMLSSDEGWAVGYGGWMAHYFDGVWHTSRPFYETYYDVDMLSADDGWIAASNGMTYHYDGSAWQEVSTPTDLPLNDINVVASGDVWAVGGDNTPSSVILHYTGGVWQQVPSPTNSPLSAINMLSADEGWAVGQNGALLHYQSGDWSQVSSPTTADLNDVQMISSAEGWAVSADGLIYHYQSGAWTEVSGQSSNDRHDLHALAIASPTEVWAVGEYGRMFYTQNGAWEQFAGISYDIYLTSEWFNVIVMVSTTDGWAAGKIGHILHYDGSAWAYAPSPTVYEITGLDMISGSDGWAVAAANTSTPYLTVFLHYDGSFWQVGQDQAAVHLYDLDMVSATDGWAVGKSGVIMRYNGGSWGFAASPTLEDLNAVAMASANEGWAVGDNGVILHYDAGTWEEVSSPTAKDLLDISIVSSLDVWASGKDGTILRGFAGSWSQVAVPQEAGGADFEAIEMISSSEGWVSGFVPSILLHYQNGNWEVYAQEWAAAYDMDFTPNGEGWMVGLWNYGLIVHKK